MLEKIGIKRYELLSNYNNIVIDLIKKKKKDNKFINIMEIGVGIGATSQEIVKYITRDDHYYFYDYHEKVNELYMDLFEKYPFLNLHACGNEKKERNSYVWTIIKQIKKGELPFFDIIFIDGAHDYLIDGLLCSLIKEYVHYDGFLVIDDVSLKPEDIVVHNELYKKTVESMYTSEQRIISQMKLVTELLLDTDDRFYTFYDDNNIKVYCKHEKKLYN